MRHRALLLLVVLSLVAATCSGDDTTDTTTDTTSTIPTSSTSTSTTTTPPSTTETATTTTSFAPAVVIGSDFDLEPGSTCEALAAAGIPYSVVVAYWVRDQRPPGFDDDGNGTPCESAYPTADVAAFFDPVASLTPGSFCRDLFPSGVNYGEAVAYWLSEGAPDRMDADRNGIPCETVYPLAEISSFYPLAPSPFTATRPPFGEFVEIPLFDDTPAYAGPATPTSLDSVGVSLLIDDALDAAARDKLADLGFVIVPEGYRLMHSPYENAQYNDTAVYVTTDAAFHYWHLAVSKLLRDAEANVMLPALEQLIAGMLTEGRARRSGLAGTDVAASMDRVVQFLEAAATTLQLDVGSIGTLAQEEAALAAAHDNTVESPTLSTGQCEVVTGFRCVYYGLFKPRGHYTRTADLERYFVTMSLLGNAGAMVYDSSDPRTADIDVESVRRGLLLAGLLTSEENLVDFWELIYEPTAFLVGNADDYTLLELRDAAVTAGYDIGDPAVLASDAAVRDIAETLVAERGVLINVPMSSVRVMGSRFVIDSYILDQLPIDNDNFFASGLDIASVFGSSLARDLRSGNPNAPQSYAGRADALRADLARRTARDWAGTVYDAWLYALQAVWADHGTAYPDYMRTPAWQAKNLQTGLGSYAELKHDTILYAKQRTAQGDFPWAPERPNWVEPDPVVYGRLAQVASMLYDGMTQRGLIEEDSRVDFLMADLQAFLTHLESIATAELAGEPLSEDDAGYLASIGALMEQLYLLSADEGDIIDQDADSAIIADIYTGQYGILEVATGRIDTIYVIVPASDGSFEVAMGGVYSYYEFKGERETDDEWRAMLNAGTEPDRPAWQEVFLAD